MRVCRCSIRPLFSCAKLNRIAICRRIILIYRIFCSNHDDSIDLRIDTVLQPIFFITDRLAKYLGRVFICVFLILISTVVYVFYTSIFIHLYKEIKTSSYNGQHTYWTFIGHVLVSHWLLINIMFNYIRCVTVDPGTSPNFGYYEPYDFDKPARDRMKIHQANIDKNNNRSNEVTILNLTNNDVHYNQMPAIRSPNISHSVVKTTNVCRKCIFPKPARAHHCSICNRCILNQDHHCPWINNCVGHLNHRYFFQFCFFLMLGASYASSFGFNEFQHYLFGRKTLTYVDLFFGRRLNDVDLLPHVKNPSIAYTMLFFFIIALTASIILFGFTIWHIRLISYSETTIDFHTNATERKRLKKLKQKFINPYNLGFILNWKMFLGINQWYEIIYKNILPSTHRPFCDGINWPIQNVNKLTQHNNQMTLTVV